MAFLDVLADNLNKSICRYKEPLAYLQSRNFNLGDIQDFKIGYSGVVSVPDDGSEDRKRFMEENYNGRGVEKMLSFPLHNVLGMTVGMIFRSIETKIYKNYFTSEAKATGCFFNLHRALPYIYSTGVAFTTEGVFDCIPFSKVMPNTISTLTAGITDVQYFFLSFFCDHIVTVFDHDAAGERETNKAKEKWQNVYKLDWGQYKDPGTCRDKLSEDAFRDFILKRSEARLSGIVESSKLKEMLWERKQK